MKILEKTLKKIILEVEINELKFDQIWDDVRSSYPATNFEIETIRNNFDSTMIITIATPAVIVRIVRLTIPIIGSIKATTRGIATNNTGTCFIIILQLHEVYAYPVFYYFYRLILLRPASMP